MAKKTHKTAAAKATKTSKGLTKKKGAKKKGAVAKKTKKTRKVAAQKKSKPIAKKKLIAKKALARKKIRKPPPESFVHKVEDAFTAVVDTLTDAERLLQKLDPAASREPE